MFDELRTDYLVIGSGLAGLSFALRAAAHGEVTIITKKRRDDTATDWAQGGIAAVLGRDDSFEEHIADTLKVGEGLCRKDIVELTVNEGPARIAELQELGVRFATKNGELELTREGGHSKRRVAHYKDITGHEIQRALTVAVAKCPNISILENHIAIDLLSTERYTGEAGCFGAFILDTASGEVKTVVSRATILAAGGSGKVYIYTSNPDVATGDGVAMAYRIGAEVANMEFVQFHPTVLYHPHAKSFLISEALRGEGGILRLGSGDTFMERYHEDRELGPRDVVARAIDNELKKSGADSVFLDMTHLERDFVVNRFPTIAERCARYGIDIAAHPIPVVPAAHYQCGGIVADEFGRTTVPGLFAIGECAHTGLHGACRLASNSLLEASVFAARAASAVEPEPKRAPGKMIPWSSGEATDSDDAIVVALNWDEIRRFMWSYVGIVRSNKRLERAARRIELLQTEIAEYYWNFKVTSDIVELRNLALVAKLIITSAQRRRESRGLHYTLDHPDKVAELAIDTVLAKDTGGP